MLISVMSCPKILKTGGALLSGLEKRIQYLLVCAVLGHQRQAAFEEKVKADALL